MKKKKMLFFTGEFPYGKRETFIENEIIYLSNFFDVEIIPTTISKHKRDIPKGVKINKTLFPFFSDKYRKYKNLLSLHFIKSIIYDYRKYLTNFSAIGRINSFLSDSNIIYKWLVRNKIDNNTIIYTYWFNGKTHGAINYRDIKDSSIKVISRAHGYDLYDYRFSPPFWPYRQHTLNFIDKLYVISNDGYDFLKSNYKISSNIEISRLGINIGNSIGKFSKEENCLRIVSVANLIRLKRIPKLFRLLERFAAENQNIKLYWSHFGDGDDMDALKSLQSDVELKNFFPNLKGIVSNDSIYNFYEKEPIDLFINVSESEGVPVSIMEAQSFGKFTIATDVGGTKEVIDEDTGVLINKDFEYEDFSREIYNYLKNKKTINNNAFMVKEKCSQKYNAKVNYIDFCNKIFELDNK